MEESDLGLFYDNILELFWKTGENHYKSSVSGLRLETQASRTRGSSVDISTVTSAVSYCPHTRN
jgi:hypothetical protein